jgi:methionine biosynthesis protein MetW
LENLRKAQGEGQHTDQHADQRKIHQIESDSSLSNTPALRPDLQLVADLVPVQSRVLDLGCGDGALLAHLIHHKQVKGRGIELSETGVLACVRRGLSVRQGNLQEGLADYPDNSFDYVVLSQTLSFLDDPQMILMEMLRVGRYAIVSFPNWGHWRSRLSLLLTGRMPKAPDLPQHWYDVPRWQAFTVTDFARLCNRLEIHIHEQRYLAGSQHVVLRRFKNLLSTTAVFVLKKE